MYKDYQYCLNFNYTDAGNNAIYPLFSGRNQVSLFYGAVQHLTLYIHNASNILLYWEKNSHDIDSSPNTLILEKATRSLASADIAKFTFVFKRYA